SADFKQLTLSDALAKADTLGVTGVEASSSQILCPDILKKVDYHLQAGERAALLRRLRELNESILAYRVDNIGPDAGSQRQVFEFAKAINIPIIITSAEGASPADLDKLANEFGIDVALDSRKDPKTTMSALEGRSKRMGVAADLGGWMQVGIKPVDGLALVKDRLIAV